MEWGIKQMYETEMQIIITVAGGAAAGAVTATLGYFKNYESEDFDAEKAAKTIILGAAVGGAAKYFNMSYADIETWFASIGATAAIEYAVKAVWRWWKSRKGKAPQPQPQQAATISTVVQA